MLREKIILTNEPVQPKQDKIRIVTHADNVDVHVSESELADFISSVYDRMEANSLKIGVRANASTHIAALRF